MLWFFPSILLCRAYVLLPLRASSLEIKLFKICISETPLCISSCLNGSWLHIEFYSYSIIGQSLGIFRITLCLPNLCWLSFKPILACDSVFHSEWISCLQDTVSKSHQCVLTWGMGELVHFIFFTVGKFSWCISLVTFLPPWSLSFWNPVSWASWMDALSCFAFLSLFCSLSCMYL